MFQIFTILCCKNRILIAFNDFEENNLTNLTQEIVQITPNNFGNLKTKS